MTTPRKIHVELDFTQLDDADRLALAGAMQQLVPESALYANTSIKDTFGLLVQAASDLAQAVETVAGAEATLAAERGVRNQARGRFDGLLLVLKTLTENNSATLADVMSMAFTPRPAKRPTTPLVVPPGIDVDLGHVHGAFTVSAQEHGPRQHYVAEVTLTPDVPASWSMLKGNGKSRKVTGFASGTIVWVRFAMTRGQDQSDWCTPVAVTVP